MVLVAIQANGTGMENTMISMILIVNINYTKMYVRKYHTFEVLITTYN